MVMVAMVVVAMEMVVMGGGDGGDGGSQRHRLGGRSGWREISRSLV